MNQKGFTPLWLIIAVVVLGLTGAVGWFVHRELTRPAEITTRKQTPAPSSKPQPDTTLTEAECQQRYPDGLIPEFINITVNDGASVSKVTQTLQEVGYRAVHPLNGDAAFGPLPTEYSVTVARGSEAETIVRLKGYPIIAEARQATIDCAIYRR